MQSYWIKKNFAHVINEAVLAAAIIILVPRLLVLFNIPFFFLTYRISYYVSMHTPLFGYFLVDDFVLALLAAFLFYRFLKLKYFIFSIATSTMITVMTYIFTKNDLGFDIYAVTLVISSIVLLMFSKSSNNIFRKDIIFNKQNFFSIFLIFLIGIMGLALSRWVSHAIFSDRIYGDQTWALARLDSSIFHGLGDLSIYLLVLIPFSFLLIPYKNYLAMISSRILNSKVGTIDNVELDDNSKKKIKNKYFFLSLILALALLLSYLPLVPSINPTNQSFGVDLDRYAERVAQYDKSKNFLDYLNYIFVVQSDKSLSYLFILAFQKTFVLSSLAAVNYIYLILVPLLVFVIYKFTKTVFENEKISILSAFFTATSTYFIGSMYGGFIANLMSIIILFGSLHFFVKFWKTGSRKYLIHTFVLMLVLLFTHVYTWTYAILVLGLFLSSSFFHYRKDRVKINAILLLSVVLIATVGVDFIKTTYNGTIGGFEKDQEISGQTISSNGFVDKWRNLAISTGIMLGTSFSNILPLFLSLIWLVNIKLKNDIHRLIGSFFFIVSVPLLFGDFSIQPRLLYMLPFNITSALGTSMMLSKISNKKVSILLVVFIVIFQLNYVLRLISNFYFKHP